VGGWAGGGQQKLEGEGREGERKGKEERGKGVGFMPDNQGGEGGRAGEKKIGEWSDYVAPEEAIQ
jgi:hypothetical protein